MELKDYQLSVIQDLEKYLETLFSKDCELFSTFSQYWLDKGVANQKYKDNISGVPHVCVKVPTAGGKTFIAVNALDTIFRAIKLNQPDRNRFVVWLVPSLTILEQTAGQLRSPDHPYRQKLSVLFNGRVSIYEKTDLLLGADFNADTVRDQLSIVVMTFDAFRAKNKEARKIYQDNGYLASFSDDQSNRDVLLPDYDASALINVIRGLNPVVVVDESHNAETDLSIEMLQNINPSFILDLTATPRNNSNVISYVNALQLKKQHMVKLPVIVANQKEKEDVVMAALMMRRQLEHYADEEFKAGGSYIRPIVLFQAEPKGKKDNVTFEKIKEQLLALDGINEEEVKIKTAEINELKGIDLSSPDCSVRYIITVNALKEGWDCPFAYILASLANKSSVVDVTQILGRVLRMPDTRRHKHDLLNLSYVFTASNQFGKTLDSVVKGLNQAGFSKNDYRQADLSGLPSILTPTLPIGSLELPLEEEDSIIDSSKLSVHWAEECDKEIAHANATSKEYASDETIQEIGGINAVKEMALAQSIEYELQANNSSHVSVPMEQEKDVKIEKIKPDFVELVRNIQLPQFFQKVETGDFFDEDKPWQRLERSNLLSDFVLSNKDATFDFDHIDAEIKKVDVEEIGKKDIKVSYSSLKDQQKIKINKIIREFHSDKSKINAIVDRLFSYVGKNEFYPIADQDIKEYLARIVKNLTLEQRDDCLDNDWRYAKIIKKKIEQLSSQYAEQEMNNWLSIERLQLNPNFQLPECLVLSETAPSIAKSLYSEEWKINNFERKVVDSIASLDNILWWHRNLEKPNGFVINGFINHYPDFIIMTNSNNLILVEAKGDHLDNSDSQAKLNLGETWENQANMITYQTGLRYHYMMIFESKAFDRAYNISDAIKLIKKL